MYAHILVPLDGSAYAEEALQPAIAIADALGARVSLLRVAIHPEGSAGDEAEARSMGYLEETAQRLPAHTTAVALHTRDGEQAAPAIVDFAHDEGVDLIIMSTHGARGDGQAALGSTAWQVAQRTSVPLLLNRARFSTGG